MSGPGTPLRSSLPSSSSLRAGNCTPSRYLPTWAGKRFLKKSTVYRLLLLVDWRGDGTAGHGTPSSALRCSANFAVTEFSEVRSKGVGLLLYHRLCWPSRGYGVRVPMHNLPCALFGPEDARDPQGDRSDVL